jgi:hypothetical protein
MTYEQAILHHDTKKWILKEAAAFTNFSKIKKIIKNMNLEQLLDCKIMLQDKINKLNK